jgi:hypothetical protein
MGSIPALMLLLFPSLFLIPLSNRWSRFLAVA